MAPPELEYDARTEDGMEESSNRDTMDAAMMDLDLDRVMMMMMMMMIDIQCSRWKGVVVR